MACLLGGIQHPVLTCPTRIPGLSLRNPIQDGDRIRRDTVISGSLPRKEEAS